MRKHFFIVFFTGLPGFYLVSFCYGQCWEPVAPTNGQVITISETEVQFICNNGYVLNGKTKSYCLNGRWEPSGQYCEVLQSATENMINCGIPGSPANGYSHLYKNKNNIIINGMNCTKGFVLIGSNIRTCKPDDSWSPDLPKCVHNLVMNSSVTHSFRSKMSTDENRTTCVNQATNVYGVVDFKKEITFDSIQVVFNHSNSNEMHIYISAPTGYNNPTVSNNQNYEEITSRHYDEITIAQPTSLGSQVSRYLAIRFAEPTAVCEIIVFNSKEETPCGLPDRPLNGFISNNKSSTVTYECISGYKMIGMNRVSCKNGVWDRVLPKCPLEETSTHPPTTRSSTTIIRSSTTTTRSTTTTTRSTTTTTRSILTTTRGISTTTRGILTTTKPTAETIELNHTPQTSFSTTEPTTEPPIDKNENENMTEIFLGVGVGLAALVLILIAVFFIFKKYRANKNCLNDTKKFIEEGVIYHDTEAIKGNNENPVYEVIGTDRMNEAATIYAELQVKLPIKQSENRVYENVGNRKNSYNETGLVYAELDFK